MNKMIDPRSCKHFRQKGVCPNWDQEIMVYLDYRVISDMSLTFKPEMFDETFQFCAHCAHFAPLSDYPGHEQTVH